MMSISVISELMRCVRCSLFASRRSSIVFGKQKTKVEYKGLWGNNCYLDAKMMKIGIQNSNSRPWVGSSVGCGFSLGINPFAK